MEYKKIMKKEDEGQIAVVQDNSTPGSEAVDIFVALTVKIVLSDNPDKNPWVKNLLREWSQKK